MSETSHHILYRRGTNPKQVIEVLYTVAIDESWIHGPMVDHALRNMSRKSTVGPITVRIASETPAT